MFQIKNISLRIRIFIAMILLVLMASVLIVGVTIYQYDEETKEYNIERFGRKEEATKVSIEQLLKRYPSDSITTKNLIKIFQQRVFEISKVPIVVHSEDDKIINENLKNFMTTNGRKEISTLIHKKFFQIGINISSITGHITYDTEENCVIDNNGNWADRLS